MRQNFDRAALKFVILLGMVSLCADMTYEGARSITGLFNTGYGLAWFLGSALMGILYDQSIGFLVAFFIVMQLASIPVFFLAKQELR